MYKKNYSMDKGVRIIGGFVLIALALMAGDVESITKTVVLIVGLYGAITGIINFCPLGYFILKEKTEKRKKASAKKTLKITDVKDLEFFEGFTDNEIGKVLSYTQLREYPRETSVIEEGKHKKIISIIFSGQFKIVKSIAENETKLITTIGDGETYGEMSFYDSEPPCVSVVSMDNAKVLEIDELGFGELVGKHPYLGIKIFTRLMHMTSSRIRALNDQITSLGNWVLQSRQQLRTLVAS